VSDRNLATGLALGALAAGVAAGAALGRVAERRLVGRPRDARDAVDSGLFGAMRATPAVVATDDGVDLWVEVDPARKDAPHADLTLVASHGFALNLDSWHFQRRALSGATRAVWWDQRGHGRSNQGAAGSHTIPRLGADLKAVIDTVAPDGPLLLLGHSMGGMTVMSAAEQYPEIADRVIGVVLLSTSSGQMSDVNLGLPSPLVRLGRRVAPSLVRRAAALDPATPLRRLIVESDLTHLLTRWYSFASPVPPGVVEVVQRMVTATPLEVIAEFLDEFDRFDGAPGLAALRGRPAEVLVGADDLLTPPPHSEAIAGQLPGARFHLVPDAGHLLQLEDPTAVTAAIRDLLARREAA
jgi:pimeloyl-ACP methyl ester carboxylesterase